ncbi:hypothetical protein DFH09DRAFT_913405, partial [Mycena vulgaris]
AVSVYDSNGIKTVHRANLSKNPAINDACCKAGEIVKRAVRTYGPKQARGNFSAFAFSLHRGSCVEPRMSKDVAQQPGVYKMLKECLEPVRKVVENIMKAEFPCLFERYKHAVDTIASNVLGTEPAFSPFASFCVNFTSKGGVVCKAHIDLQNLGPGLCVVIPFGHFDPKRDCKLVVWELGFIFQVAAGQPIFFPSALYTHYNTVLISMGMRGSIVAWTGASIFQYVDLGCRAVCDLNPGELKEYREGLKERARRGFDLFPRRS